MQLRRPWLIASLLACVAAPAAVVYKWTDAEGVIHYSDQSVPGAERIITAGPGPSSPNLRQPAAPAAPAKPAAKHATLAIEAPTAEQSFFGDDPVLVRLHVEPALQPDQVITWFLNGKRLEDQGPTATEFSLQGLPRGTYAIGALLTDRQSGETQSSDPVTFYVRQPSLLSPQHPKP